MDVLLKICCIFSEYLFLRTPLDGCFCYFPMSAFGHNIAHTISHFLLAVLRGRCFELKIMCKIMCKNYRKVKMWNYKNHEAIKIMYVYLKKSVSNLLSIYFVSMLLKSYLRIATLPRVTEAKSYCYLSIC